MYCTTSVNDILFPPFLFGLYMVLALFLAYQTNLSPPQKLIVNRQPFVKATSTTKVRNKTPNNSQIILRRKRKKNRKYSLLLYFKMLDYLDSLNYKSTCQLARLLGLTTYQKYPFTRPLRDRIKSRVRLRAEILRIFRNSPEKVLIAVSRSQQKQTGKREASPR